MFEGRVVAIFVSPREGAPMEPLDGYLRWNGERAVARLGSQLQTGDHMTIAHILGLSPDADDETIRRRYLELVRQFSPEHHPEKFAAVRAAYERLRDLDTRLRHRLFEVDNIESLDALVEEIAWQSRRRRMSLRDLLSLLPK